MQCSTVPREGCHELLAFNLKRNFILTSLFINVRAPFEGSRLPHFLESSSNRLRISLAWRSNEEIAFSRSRMWYPLAHDHIFTKQKGRNIEVYADDSIVKSITKEIGWPQRNIRHIAWHRLLKTYCNNLYFKQV